MRSITFLFFALTLLRVTFVSASDDSASDSTVVIQMQTSEIDSVALIANQELKGELKEEAERRLHSLMFGKTLIAKMTFPASKDGIDLKTKETMTPPGVGMDAGYVTRCIKDNGVGIDIGEAATITDFKIKDKHVEIHLNGGGVGTFGDMLMGADKKDKSSKVAGGSRINLRWDRQLRVADMKLETIAYYISAVVDPASLYQDAMNEAIAPEYREAAASRTILEGMDKATVFAIMGEPKNKNVDISGEVPIEKWQYELGNLKVRLITFKEGRVAKVNEF